ncbi:hypothetical protein ACVBEQ_09260 [Nakamurella sp. GG22]
MGVLLFTVLVTVLLVLLVELGVVQAHGPPANRRAERSHLPNT